ncbi:MAG: heparan-alpha-glucosaminide N-acetyltransferase domain-containing protein [Bacteroidota bacterium]
MKQERDQSVDILRGIAIFAMIAANMAAHSLQEPHSFLFRLYGSIAAPLFVFLAGMMVSVTSKTKSHPIQYYLKRAVAVLFIASLIDIFLWNIIPFTTFDVLYVIAFAMPLIYYFNKLKTALRISIVFVLFVVAPILQNTFGYIEYPLEVNVFRNTNFSELSLTLVLKQFFIDGWFPLFPWLGVSFLGAVIGSYKIKTPIYEYNKRMLITGFVLLFVGIISWIYFNPKLFIREGYSELFYPPTLYYLASILGFIFILSVIIYQFKSNKFINLLSVYGQSSLLVYILHTVLIVFVFNEFDSYSPLFFTVLYFLHALALWAVCYFIKLIKKDKKLPFLVTLILGH